MPVSLTADFTAQEVLARLRRHYIKPGELLPGGVFMSEVQAPHAPRRIDALYIGFTRSRGHFIQGHEIKVKRADWLKELSDASKAEAWWRHCHYWWIVAPLGVVREEELPDGWGLMYPGKSKVRMEIRVKATYHEPELTMGLVLELAKKLDLYRAQAITATEQKVRDEQREKQATQQLPLDHDAEYRRKQGERALELVADFQARTGVSLERWEFEATTNALKEWVDGATARKRILSNSKRLARDLRRNAEGIIQQTKELEDRFTG